jgi:hypothetical protein
VNQARDPEDGTGLDRAGLEKLWAARMAPLASPLACREGLSRDDTWTLHQIRFRIERLLEYQAVLPAALVAMLRDYQQELAGTADVRWDGIGSPVRAAYLAAAIGQDITDGLWAPGGQVYMKGDGTPPWYFLAERSQTARRAMQLLAARGEVTIRDDGYYVRARDDHPR